MRYLFVLAMLLNLVAAGGGDLLKVMAKVNGVLVKNSNNPPTLEAGDVAQIEYYIKNMGDLPIKNLKVSKLKCDKSSLGAGEETFCGKKEKSVERGVNKEIINAEAKSCKIKKSLLKNSTYTFEDNSLEKFNINMESHIIDIKGAQGKKALLVAFDDGINSGESDLTIKIEPHKSYMITLLASKKELVDGKDPFIKIEYLDSKKNPIKKYIASKDINNEYLIDGFKSYTLSLRKAPTNSRYLKITFSTLENAQLLVDNLKIYTYKALNNCKRVSSKNKIVFIGKLTQDLSNLNKMKPECSSCNDCGCSGCHAVVGDWVWNDLNRNGIQDGGEPGVAGVRVHLYTSSGKHVASTVTDSSGHYYFRNVCKGKYRIKFDVPSGWTVSPRGRGGDGYRDSNAYSNGWTNAFEILYVYHYFPCMDMGIYRN
ncbi:MAG: hypothetical protein GXO02_06215, partial [Epsilonproteobacteria bacterium]|nr:hypothetical protein [Campylobacterota bacterium]